MAEAGPGRGALAGVRVIDASTVLAGPGAARHLGDFGADVIKVEPPAGDSLRRMGWKDPRDGESLMWKITGRNKRTVVLDLKEPADLAVMRRLCAEADVLVENGRPGTLERLGLAPADLHAANPGLVILRVTGFGQDGPYAGRPGFATIAEAMSGYAGISGEPDGPPLLPPVALTDEITALAGAFAVLVALRHRDRTGEGQVIDVNLLETMVQMLGALPSAWTHLGYVQPRMGAGIPYSVPRGTYRCADGVWVAVSASADTVATRVLALLGLDHDERFASFDDRVRHRDELDERLRSWIAGRPSGDVLRAFEAAQAAISPVYDVAQLCADPHVVERSVFVDVRGVTMPGPVARLSRSPGTVRHPGRGLGADTEGVRRSGWGGPDEDTRPER